MAPRLSTLGRRIQTTKKVTASPVRFASPPPHRRSGWHLPSPSGATGKIRTLNPAEVKRVAPLLKERQRLGRQLAAALETTGFALADDGIIDLEV
jgi:hypothetical protein